jgi:hypothetical protein
MYTLPDMLILGLCQGCLYSPSTMFMWPLCMWQVTNAWENTPLSLRTLFLVSVCVRECLCLSLLLITSLKDTLNMMRLYNSMCYCACWRGHFNELINAVGNIFLGPRFVYTCTHINFAETICMPLSRLWEICFIKQPEILHPYLCKLKK